MLGLAQGQKLMTSGSIPKQMVFFALPILLGNLFQQLYNTVDSLNCWKLFGESGTCGGEFKWKHYILDDWLL